MKQTEKSTNKLKLALMRVLPWKNDSKREILRKSVSLIALALFIGAAVYLLGYYLKGGENKAKVEEARTIYNPQEDGVNGDGMLVRFEELYKKNNDIVGWIKIDGTAVDYPVYQTDNNDFYVDHDMSKQKSRYGAIFVDKNCKITQNGTSTNLTLYGHNMIDRSMFTELLDYKNLSYYRKNPLITFDTVYEKGAYKVFAVIVTNADKEDDDGFVFNYRQNSFSSEMGFLTFIENLKVRSVINTGVDVEYGDSIITLSTCSYEFDNARTVVFARRLRDNEASYIDTSKASVNKTPLYPEAYYEKNGGKKPKVKIKVKKSEENETTSSGSSSVSSGDIISGTQGFITVGNYVGASLENALAQVNEAGLSVKEIVYDGSDEKFNTVTKQSLKHKEKVAKGSGITLYVTGKAAKITVPDFVGLKLKKAKKVANKNGMSINIMTMASALEKNVVISQSIDAGTVIDSRSIVLYVSSGKNKVPKVTGKTKEKAEQLILDAGFKVKVIEKVTKEKDEIGKVIKQSPKKETYKEVGDEVKIYVGVKKKTETDKKDTTSSAVSDK